MSAGPKTADRAWAQAEFDRETEVQERGPDPIETAGLRHLAPGAEIRDIENALRRLGTMLAEEPDGLRREAVREEALRKVKELGVGAPARLVDAALFREQRAVTEDKTQARALTIEDPGPWPESVSGTELLEDVASLISRHIVLPQGAAEVIALWVAHTYLMEAWDHTGHLPIVSATRRCGRTTLLRLLDAIACRAVSADNVSPAALYRLVEKAAPTLVVDELDRIDRS